MALPTVTEITRLYLYGMTSVPDSLLDAALIRPDVTTANLPLSFPVDKNEYMDTGPGRFVNAASFETVRRFFLPDLDPQSLNLQPSPTEGYTKQQLFTAFGLDGNNIEQLKRRAAIIRQTDFDDSALPGGRDDLFERSYIWQTTAFQIDDRARFHIDANGNRWITNFGIVPFSNETSISPANSEPFDFKGAGLLSEQANPLLEQVIDPSKIGRTVNIVFQGERPVIEMFTLSNFNAAESSAVSPTPFTNALKIRAAANAFAQQFFNDDEGTARFLDAQNRPILYGTDQADVLVGSRARAATDISQPVVRKGGFLGTVVSQLLVEIAQPLAPFVQNGIAYVTGKGADRITGGTANDYLMGGLDNDSLDGGLGADTYVWNAGDGLDTITDARGVDGVKSGTIEFLGQTLAGTKTQVDPNNPRLFQDSRGIRYTLTGIPGAEGMLQIRAAPGDTTGINITAFKSGDFGIVIPTAAPIQKTDKFGTDDHDSHLASDAADQKVFGLLGNDRIFLTHANTEGYGGLGSDHMTNDVGDQKLFGEDGSDLLEASGGFDELYGGADADVLQGGADDDYLEGNGGGDVLDGGFGSDVLYGGDGNDFIVGGGTLTAGWSAGIPPSFGTLTVGGVTGPAGVSGSVLIDEDGGDFIDAGAGIDTVFAGSGNDFARGGLDNDLVVGFSGDDALEGNEGDDAIYGDATQGEVSLGGEPVYTFPEFHGADMLWGGAGNDFLAGDGGADELYGEAGDDTLVGDSSFLADAYHGADYLDGGDGNDQMFGYGGNDWLLGGTGNDSMQGDADTVAFANHGNDYLDGEAGDDSIAGLGGHDTLFGGDGMDQLFGDSDDTPVANHGDDYLDGGEGNDYLRAYAGNDTLFGGIGNDSLQGEAGDDYLDGEAGDDILEGGEGNDQLFGGLDNDGLLGGAGDDFVDGGDGDDLLFGGNGTDQVFGGVGADQVGGDDGDDLLDGGDGDDRLFGNAGNDMLIGGAGRDTFVGGAGDDTFIANFAESEGVVDLEGINTLQIAYGGSVSALAISQAFDPEGGVHLMLASGEQFVQIKDGFAGAVSIFDFGGTVVTREQLMAQAQVESLVLAGGVGSQHFIGSNSADQIDGGADADTMQGGAGSDAYIVDDTADVIVENTNEGIDTVESSASYTLAANVENLTLTGTQAIDATGNASDNVLTGNAASNTLDGGAGNDTLAGGHGADTYRFGRGYGQDVIQESDDGTSPVDRVLFAADTLPADIVVTRTATDLVLSIAGTSDSLAIAGYFSSPAGMVEEFHFAGGTVWDEAVIAQNLSNGTAGNDIINGTAGNDLLNGLAGNDTISGLAGDDRLFGEQGLDSLNGGDGTDILIGGLNNDLLSGGDGGDTYQYARGDGLDTINEVDSGVGGIDRIELSADILPAEVSVRRSGQDLQLRVSGTAEGLNVFAYFNNDASGPQTVEEVRFADGTVWDTATVKAMALAGTPGNDALTGYATDDVISGLAGHDTIVGGAGDDILIGGPGANVLTGSAGNDVYRYEAADAQDDILNGDASAATTDVLLFGPGILPSSMVPRRIGTNFEGLWLRISDVAGVDIPFQFVPGHADAIDEIRFTDDPSTVWTMSALRAIFTTGTANDDTLLIGFETNDTIDGLGGDDLIQGLAGNDTLRGGAGSDSVLGNQGNDDIDGGAGRDTLTGGAGDETYRFGRGYGHDIVDETIAALGAGNDTLRLNAGILPADVTLRQHTNDLVLTIAGDTAQAWIPQYMTLANKPIEQIVFDDGTVWNTAAIASRIITATPNAMTGTAGNDTFIVDHGGDTITEGVNQGTDTVQSSVTYALGSNLENLTLTGILDTEARGNSGDNVLTGNVGDNVLDGDFGGADTLIGGLGNDRYFVGSSSQSNPFASVVELAGEGEDTLHARSGSATLPANVENLVMEFSAFSNRNATGNALNNRITVPLTAGSSSAVVIDGGLGADTMTGGFTRDTFVIDNPGDIVIEPESSSIDTVRSPFDYTLGTNLENLELQFGSGINGTGNASNNDLAGNNLGNLLLGLGGNDILFGGLGADTLVGGLGNDVYVLAERRTVISPTQITYAMDSASSVNQDTLTEGANEGVDTVRSFFDYTLEANFENLELLQQGGAVPVNPLRATGNALDNRLTGNSAANVIDGREGADTMIGGFGDDTYFVDNVGDVVTENAGPLTGTDTVFSQVSYILGAEVENLTLTGTAAISGTGNSLANTLDGSQNSAANVLAGGLGNDTYVVDGGDVIVENAGGGIDTVTAAFSYTLGANVENLTLAGAAVSGTGSADGNTITGNALDNVLDGGAGADTLRGMAGNDIYLVDDAADVADETGGGGIDTVRAAVSYTLGSGLENLVLIGDSGATGTGNALDNVLDGSQNSAADVLAGGLGNDTYLVGSGDTIVESVDGGIDVVQSDVSFTLGANVESLVLTGSAAISGTGDALDNTLDGSQNSAANTLAGGLGDDTYILGAGDTVVENAGEGTDTVLSDSTYVLSADIENLVLTGGAAMDGTGNALDNILTGNAAANTLEGGAGADLLSGGAGDDTYRFGRGSGNDSISEDDNNLLNTDTVEMAADVAPGDVSGTRSGSDLVLSIAGTPDSLTLISFFADINNQIDRVVFADGTIWDTQTLWQMGVITGTPGADTLNGTTSNDDISGLGGNDTLNGFAGDDQLDGGTGADSMNGDTGDDTYIVDNAGDIVTESSSAGGIDGVISEVSWTLGNNVENLALEGTNAINATGNALDNVLFGNIANNTLNGGAGADFMEGWLGNDTYVVDNLGDVVAEVLDGGIDLVQSSVSHTLSAEVENLTLTLTSPISGTGNELNNVLTGNSGANTLSGGAGNDTLSGGAGNDTMLGGAGDDLYVRDVTGDVVTELAGEGVDTVQSSVTYTLAANVENLTLTGTSAINGTGNALDNVLTGNSGNNVLTGGAGNDTYFVGTGDTTTEAANAGTDTVMSGGTWTLANNLENLTLTGTTAINGTGNTLNNVLTGNIANNTLNGGTGADTLIGGLGNDTYVVDNLGDLVSENPGEGTDLVQSSITYTLLAEVENLTLTGTATLSGTGNALNNSLTGNTGANTLNGGAGNDTLSGGSGADTMIGGTGDDTYVRDNTGDIVTELADEGIDTVQSSVTYTLAANVENLTLTNTTALNGTGNALNNVLTGNSGNNVLTGLGGDDTYFLTTGDTVTEAAGGGEDLVNIGATHTLAANVENLILTGTTAINGTGNALNNLLRGNSGVNTLAGAAGNDVLEGGGGNDILGDTGGANLFNGQAGTDTLNGNTGKELLIGGAANDTVNTSSGADIIAFNRGDGADTVAVSTVKDNSLSLGGGIAYTDLFFQKSGNNLILKTAGAAGAEQVTFTNWYAATANRSVLNLQMVVEASADFDAGSADPLRNRKVAEFNFDALVSQFDAALAANPGLTSWALNNALTSFHLGGSDSEALGGDLAYRYGLQGNLAAVGSVGAQNVLGAAQFGTAVQAFQAQPALEAGMMRLT